MSLTVDKAVELVRQAQKEESKAREKSIQANSALIDAARDHQASQINLQEVQRVLLELLAEENA